MNPYRFQTKEERYREIVKAIERIMDWGGLDKLTCKEAIEIYKNGQQRRE